MISFWKWKKTKTKLKNIFNMIPNNPETMNKYWEKIKYCEYQWKLSMKHFIDRAIWIAKIFHEQKNDRCKIVLFRIFMSCTFHFFRRHLKVINSAPWIPKIWCKREIKFCVSNKSDDTLDVKMRIDAWTARIKVWP